MNDDIVLVDDKQVAIGSRRIAGASGARKSFMAGNDALRPA